MSADSQHIEITGEPTTDPQVCKFTVSLPLYAEKSVSCASTEMAEGSPLLQALFEIDGVREVFVHGHSVTIANSGDQDWPSLGRQIGAAIRGAFASGEPLIAEVLAERKPSEIEIRKQVEELLNRDINPQVSSHGGSIDVVDVKGTTVFVHLSGGCQGCASASLTLRQGVERAIFKGIPQVTQVVDVTDHAAGANPYYR